MTATTTPHTPTGPASPLSSRHRRVYARMVHAASTRTGLVVLYWWAFCEALFWPLIPDSALMGMAFAAPRRLARQWTAAVAGMLSGGLVGLTASRLGLDWPLPLVTGRMRDAAAEWLLADGAAGLWHQPLSGVPYKTFVLAAGHHDVGTLGWVVHSLGARGSRMLTMGLVAATAGWLLRRFVPDRFRPALHLSIVVITTLLLFAGLALVVFLWSDAWQGLTFG